MLEKHGFPDKEVFECNRSIYVFIDALLMGQFDAKAYGTAACKFCTTVSRFHDPRPPSCNHCLAFPYCKSSHLFGRLIIWAFRA